MNAARVLREARKRAGLSQRRLAAKAGVAQPAIARIERGLTIPRVDTLDKLLEACGEGLYAELRIGMGVDKTLMERELTLTPANRFYRMNEWSKTVHGIRMHARVPSVVRESFRPPADPGPILSILVAHEVVFVVLGGIAGGVYGVGRPTYDVDICYARDDENIRRLVSALREMHSSPRGAPKDLPNVIDERFIRNGLNFTFDTDHGDFDCLGEPAGTAGYEDLRRNATLKDIGAFVVACVSLSDLIRMKRAAGRTKDLSDIEYLGALQEVIDEEERKKRGR